MRRVATVLERFDAKVTPEPNTGCWLWTASVRDSGYGMFYWQQVKRPIMAHRASWMLFRGSIPPAMQIDHICRVRSCVNPEHLRVVTLRQNVLENSYGVSALNRKKTHCRRGHPLSGANLRLGVNRYGGPQRDCRSCAALHSKARWQRKLALRKANWPLTLAAVAHEAAAKITHGRKKKGEAA